MRRSIKNSTMLGGGISGSLCASLKPYAVKDDCQISAFKSLPVQSFVAGKQLFIVAYASCFKGLR